MPMNNEGGGCLSERGNTVGVADTDVQLGEHACSLVWRPYLSSWVWPVRE
jgi:hypothetical protein